MRGIVMLTIRTERLDIIAATAAHLDIELKSLSDLAILLDARVPEGWPPGEYDRQAMEYFRTRLLEDKAAAGWLSWYAVLRASDESAATLVGVGGYFGPPEADGVVEIGYSIMPSFEGRGFATELVRALVSRAFASERVTCVIARTHQDNRASIRVLEKCGFSMVSPDMVNGIITYSCRR
jgi:[ribosomal protein S5]-alanine N-acetyltransferase